MKRLSAASLLLLASIGTAPAGADPMRPLPPPAGAASAPAAGPASAGAFRREAVAAAPDKAIGRLVAIREDSHGQRQALIGERWVAEGDRIDGAVVHGIDANSVELGAGRSRTRLHLLPPLVASSSEPPSTLAAHTDAPPRRPPAATAGPLPAKPPRAPMRRSPTPTTFPPEGRSP